MSRHASATSAINDMLVVITDDVMVESALALAQILCRRTVGSVRVPSAIWGVGAEAWLNQELSRLDEELNLSYRDALKKVNDKRFLRHWQREWLTSNQVAGCEDSPCLTDAFSARLGILNSLAPANSAIAGRNGRYIRYRQGRADDSASLMRIPFKDIILPPTGIRQS